MTPCAHCQSKHPEHYCRACWAQFVAAARWWEKYYRSGIEEELPAGSPKYVDICTHIQTIERVENRRAYSRRYRADAQAKKTAKVCQCCGEAFTSLRRGDAKFCSNACRQKSHRRAEPKPELLPMYYHQYEYTRSDGQVVIIGDTERRFPFIHVPDGELEAYLDKLYRHPKHGTFFKFGDQDAKKPVILTPDGKLVRPRDIGPLWRVPHPEPWRLMHLRKYDSGCVKGVSALQINNVRTLGADTV